MSDNQEHVIIIGNGISGVTAARYIRKMSDKRITIISAETEHFFSRTALMYVYMGHMRYDDLKPYEDFFWKKNRLDLVFDYVNTINTQNKTLQLRKKGQLSYDRLILATGSAPNYFGWPGQDLQAVQGLYSYADLQGMEAYSSDTKHAVIVGGGLIGIEMAEMFHSRNISVTLLVRERSYWSNVLPTEESAMINRHIKEHHFDLRLQTELKEILGDDKGRVCAVMTNKGEKIACQFVGLTAGVHPNIDFIRQSENCDVDTQKGILVNDFLETTAPDIYAIGDCAQLMNPTTGRRSIEAIWYTGRMMGETVAHTICGKRTAYVPRLWFNSAKFLDIEYQVYGTIDAKPKDNQTQLYWEHKNGRQSIRLVFDKESKAILGFNLMGIRYRHEVCEKWILEKTSVEVVLQNLGLANFDPEFFKEYEAEVVALYNKQFNANVVLRQQRSLTAALRFLKNKLTLQA